MPKEMAGHKVLSVREFAKFVGVDPKTATRWAGQGQVRLFESNNGNPGIIELKFFRHPLNGHWLIREDDAYRVFEIVKNTVSNL